MVSLSNHDTQRVVLRQAQDDTLPADRYPLSSVLSTANNGKHPCRIVLSSCGSAIARFNIDGIVIEYKITAKQIATPS